MDIIDIMMVLLPIALIIIALLLACATAIVRVTRNAWVTRRRRTVDINHDRRSGFGRAAGDPFLFPFGDMPTVPRERLMVARDFRAWGIPDVSQSGGALRRNESGGRPASTPGTAVVLSVPKRRA